MKRPALILVALSGCADDSTPPLDIQPCTAFANSQTELDGGCRVDLRGIDWTFFRRDAFNPVQLMPDGTTDYLITDSEPGTFDFCEATPAMWSGDAGAGAAVFVGQDNVGRNAEGLTCAWVRCLEPR